MVAYSFKERFAQPILDGTKVGTIRLIGRRRHARRGEALQLYVGMRTISCRLVKRDTCVHALPIRLTMTGSGDFDGAAIDGKQLTLWQMQELARDDGFSCIADMAEFWMQTHGKGKPIIFDGVNIRWRPITWL